MAFIGWLNENGGTVEVSSGGKVTFNDLPAGTYYAVDETGELFDDESGANDACFSSNGATDDDEDTFDDEYQTSTYTEHKVMPYVLTRQRSWYRSSPSINISRDPSSVPPGMLCGGNGFRTDYECDTREEALETAKLLAARWAAIIREPVEIEYDSAEMGGDEATYTALPSGLVFPGGFEELVLA
jgi:hypothetical protein